MKLANTTASVLVSHNIYLPKDHKVGQSVDCYRSVPGRGRHSHATEIRRKKKIAAYRNFART